MQTTKKKKKKKMDCGILPVKQTLNALFRGTSTQESFLDETREFFLKK